MTKNPAEAFDGTELSAEALEQVHGGKAGAVFSFNGSIGPFSGSVAYSPGNGWYVSGGVGKPGIGADVSFGIVAPLPGKTVDDVLTGWSAGGSAYLGGGGRVDANLS